MEDKKLKAKERARKSYNLHREEICKRKRQRYLESPELRAAKKEENRLYYQMHKEKWNLYRKNRMKKAILQIGELPEEQETGITEKEGIKA